MEQQAIKAPATMTVKEMAATLRIGINRAYDLCHAEGFPAVWVSERRCVIPVDSFNAWLCNRAATAKEGKVPFIGGK